MFSIANKNIDFLLMQSYNILVFLLPFECEVFAMAVSYKKLWKLLIDKDLKKKDLEQMAHISHYTMNKLTRGDNVTIDILGRVCQALDCGVDDIMEFIPDKNI